MEKKCPVCYFNLPDPQTVLAPYDTELDYFMWGPGFEWQPDPVEESESSVEESYEESTTSDEEYGSLSGRVDKNDAKSLFNEKARSGKISVQDASQNARKLGLAPSSTDEEKITTKYGDNLDMNQYMEYLSMCVHESDNAEDLSKVFSNFDIKGQGYLTKKQMKIILTTWGDALTEEEATQILNSFSNEDIIDYRRFCEEVLR